MRAKACAVKRVVICDYRVAVGGVHIKSVELDIIYVIQIKLLFIDNAIIIAYYGICVALAHSDKIKLVIYRHRETNIVYTYKLIRYLRRGLLACGVDAYLYGAVALHSDILYCRSVNVFYRVDGVFSNTLRARGNSHLQNKILHIRAILEHIG